jgi:fructose-bisphosphate aldolase class I
MNAQELIDIARVLIAGDKGLLAMDESTPTCNKRFAKLGIPQTEEARRAYRELIVTTPDLGECISGAILYDETIRQKKKDGTPLILGWGEFTPSLSRGRTAPRAGLEPASRLDLVEAG